MKLLYGKELNGCKSLEWCICRLGAVEYVGDYESILCRCNSWDAEQIVSTMNAERWEYLKNNLFLRDGNACWKVC